MNQDRLKQLLRYDPEAGEFTWIAKASRNTVVGSRAGSKDRQGYGCVRVDRRLYAAHRLAWLYMTGEWPKNDIDHVNGQKSDNRWSNLRDVPHRLNTQNVRSAHFDSRSRLLGVSACGKRWRAYISEGGAKQKHLGCFPTRELAHAAYIAAKAELHEGFVR